MWRIIGLVVLGSIVVGIWAGAMFLSQDCSTRLSNAGQAVGFVAGGVAVYALVLGLRQLDLQRVAIDEQVKEQARLAAQRHADDEQAHMDKLSTAYARWFEVVLPVLIACFDKIHNVWGRADGPQRKESLEHVYRRERELRLAAIPLLMLERRDDFRARLERTFTPLPSWTGGYTEAEMPSYRAHIERVATLVRERQDDVEHLFSDVAVAARIAPKPTST